VTGADPAGLRRRADRLRRRLGDDHADDPLVQAAVAELAALADGVEAEARRLQAEQAALTAERDRLAAERLRSRRLFDVAPEAYVITDADGIIRRDNPGATDLFGTAGSVGSPLELRFVPDDRARVQALATSCGRGAPAGSAVVTLEGRGPPVRVEVRCALAGEDELLWLVRDVTADEAARARLQDAVDRARGDTEQLRELDDARNAFVLAVSHDLQAPLAAIAGLADLLLQQARLPASNRRRMLERIHSTAAQLLDDLRDLLDLERLHHGEVGLERQRIDVAALIAAATDAAEFGERDVVVEAEATPAEVDPTIVRRIVDNLLVNAAQHTPPGTTVWVRLRRAPDGLLLVVEDDGPGVPSELRSQVFEPLGRDGQHGDGAPGVGLALVRQFAELHGGAARVEARRGGGASFQVLLSEAGGP
jgi:signal transduction histidine kinase